MAEPVAEDVLFSQYDKNVLTVVTPLPTVNLYDIELTSDMRKRDFILYIFPRTLVGQDTSGEAARDLYLWIMVGQVMFSQGNTWVRKNHPDT